MDLPEPIRIYFEADARGDATRLKDAFARDAVVHDEGAVPRGAQAISDWWRSAKERYRHAAQPLASSGAGREWSVRAKVSGDFAGSPIELTFAFRLADDRISALEIGR